MLVIEAIELDDLAHLREELGDVLLQVAFHSRLAEERPAAERFSIDDVAADLVAKLIRRHPHVFAGREVASAADLAANGSVASVEPAWWQSGRLTMLGRCADLEPPVRRLTGRRSPGFGSRPR